MVNPGAFQGSRKEFLLGERVEYAAGVDGGYAADALAVIQRRYFKRYPIDLSHVAEPDPEFLAAVNDEEPEPEVLEPNEDELQPSAYATAIKLVEVRRTMVLYRKAQIKRWLAYQYMKAHDIDPKESGAHNPFRSLLHKLTGAPVQKPRLKTPVNLWRKTQRTAIDQKVATSLLAEPQPPSKLAALRDRMAREMFAQLPRLEQMEWRDQAKEDHDAALAAWEAENNEDCSTVSADRQRCIQGLVSFAQPILDLICQATGWKASLIAGGPEPAHDGRLNIISIHSGTTTGDVPMNFGRAERVRFKKHVVPVFGRFLQQCYTPEECRSRALPAEEGFEPLTTMDLEGDGADFDSVGFALGTSTIRSTAATITSAPATSTTSAPATITSQADQGAPPSRENSPSLGASPAPSPPPSRDEADHGASPFRDNTPSLGASPAPSLPPSRAASPTVDAPSLAEVPAAVKKPKIAKKRKSSTKRKAPVARQDDEGMADTTDDPAPPAKRLRTQRGPVVPATSSISETKTQTRTRTRSAVVPAISPPTDSSKALPVVTTLSAPPSAPNWFVTTLSMLQAERDKLGPPWIELVSRWARFEDDHGYKEVSKLKATKRPSVVSDWIQRKRSPNWRPVIKDLEAYEEEFTTWWTSLQPEWRIVDGEIDEDATDGDWAELRKPGTNGIVSVLAALFYWGLDAHKVEVHRERWCRAVADCHRALQLPDA